MKLLLYCTKKPYFLIKHKKELVEHKVCCEFGFYNENEINDSARTY